jgi:hypothetical protein
MRTSKADPHHIINVLAHMKSTVNTAAHSHTAQQWSEVMTTTKTVRDAYTTHQRDVHSLIKQQSNHAVHNHTMSMYMQM